MIANPSKAFVLKEQKAHKTVFPHSSPEACRQEATSRRDFLTRAGHTVAGVCTLSALAGGVRVAMPAFEEGPAQRFPLGRLSDFKMSALTWLQDRDLFVIRNEDGLGAFSSRCTHLGCVVRRTAQGFVCPCHGAEYGPLGEVISGPARRPLPWYRVWLARDGRLWVDVSKALNQAGPKPVVLPQEDEA
jgi:Rieske Fe-S protein